MTNSNGRRGLPAEPEIPVRRLPAPTNPSARRGITPEPTRQTSQPVWIVAVVLPIVIALVMGGLWLVFGERGDGGLTAEPSPSPVVSSTPETSPPQASPTEASPTAGPTPSPTDSPRLPTEPEPEPSPISSVPGGVLLELNGTVLDMPPGWQLYGDELIQDDRRLVRIRDVTHDVRIQAVSLTNVVGPLATACQELVRDHRELYTGVAQGLPVDVPLAGAGEGASCAFTGTRASDAVANQVEFTLLRLNDTTLVFRDTIPASAPEDAPARSQLVAMECAAAESFGIAVSQCALIPGPGDG